MVNSTRLTATMHSHLLQSFFPLLNFPLRIVIKDSTPTLTQIIAQLTESIDKHLLEVFANGADVPESSDETFASRGPVFDTVFKDRGTIA